MTATLSHRRRGHGAIALALVLALAPPAAAMLTFLAPVAAEARPGGGMSMGSRGSHTFSAPPITRTDPGGASSFDRSLTPRSGYGQQQYGGGYNGGGLATGMRAHPFATGLAGGLLGAGIGRMLFGFGGGYGGFGGGLHFGLFGLLIELAIAFFVIRWLMRRFMGGGNGAVMAPAMANRIGNSGNLTITPTDYQQFEQGLRDVQQAWSMQDMRSLSRFATPEMVSYFSEQLTDLASRNLRNAVSDVRMEQGDLSEAWSEGGREFATVAMRYSLIDVTTDLTGRVVDGSPNERQQVTELWTFVRARGGSWLLSAIQQAR